MSVTSINKVLLTIDNNYKFDNENTFLKVIPLKYLNSLGNVNVILFILEFSLFISDEISGNSSYWAVPIILSFQIFYLLHEMNRYILLLLLKSFEFCWLQTNIIFFTICRLSNEILQAQEFLNLNYGSNKFYWISNCCIWNISYMIAISFILSIDSMLNMRKHIKLICMIFLLISQLFLHINTTYLTKRPLTKICLIGCTDLDSLSLTSMSNLIIFSVKFLYITIRYKGNRMILLRFYIV
jgi:hypothetical protein